MKGSVSIDETAHINKELAEVPADASLAPIILMRVGEQCSAAPLKDSPQPHCIKGRLKGTSALGASSGTCTETKSFTLAIVLFKSGKPKQSQLLSELDSC